jgi:hypothetical protein
MEIDWKKALKWIPVVGLVLAIFVWLFSPSDPRFNRK